LVRISVRFQESVAVISLSGKFLAGGDGPYLRQKVQDLMDAGTRQLVLDFADVPYIDSTGLGFLAGSREAAAQAGTSIVLASLNEHVRRILDGVKLSQFFEIAETEAAALDRLKQIAAGTTARPAKPRVTKGAKRSASSTESQA
jgi:anti-sigma B factor antagonist